jgi:hypothetical protein
MTSPRWCPRPACGVRLYSPSERCLPHEAPNEYNRVNRLAQELLAKARES